MTFNWIGSGFLFGVFLDFFSITAFGVEQIFQIYKSNDEDQIFYIKKAKDVKNNLIEKNKEVYEKINNIYLIKTDDEFRKKYKRTYNLLKFECENNEVITIGAYTDSKNIPTPDNTYILCENDFINILAKPKIITSHKDLEETEFNGLKSILNKNELTKELLK
jgi:hypothetical protein